MAEKEAVGEPLSPAASCADHDAAIARLRQQGADRLDPAGLHFIEALARRCRREPEAIRRRLDDKLAQALTACERRLDRARNDAARLLTHASERFPDAAGALQDLLAAGDVAQLRRQVARLERYAQRSPLAELDRRLTPPASPDEADPAAGAADARRELKSVRLSRNLWSKLSADRRVEQALDQAPERAGPINSHMLILRCLALMREISPDYLNRFVAHADTLLWLEQANREGAAPGRPTLSARNARSRSRRERSR
jgi:hypothetical protein